MGESCGGRLVWIESSRKYSVSSLFPVVEQHEIEVSSVRIETGWVFKTDQKPAGKPMKPSENYFFIINNFGGFLSKTDQFLKSSFYNKPQELNGFQYFLIHSQATKKTKQSTLV
jgi:hypothetical protein